MDSSGILKRQICNLLTSKYVIPILSSVLHHLFAMKLPDSTTNTINHGCDFS